MLSKAFVTHLADTSRLATPLKASVLPCDRHADWLVVVESPDASLRLARSFSSRITANVYLPPKQKLDLSQVSKAHICAPAA